jgi:hypothetical protein
MLRTFAQFWEHWRAGSIQALHIAHACMHARVLACTRSVRAGCPRETTPIYVY